MGQEKLQNTSCMGTVSHSTLMSQQGTTELLGSRARPVRKADNLTSICELTVQTMCDPCHLTTL
jgi:hypothetical protein